MESSEFLSAVITAEIWQLFHEDNLRRFNSQFTSTQRKVTLTHIRTGDVFEIEIRKVEGI